VPLAGAAAREATEQLLLENRLGTDGTFELGGQTVSLADIKVPFRSLVAADDTIVSNEASEPACRLVGSADCEEIRVPGGHIGLFVGRGAHKRSIPKVLEFITSVSDQVAADGSEESVSAAKQ
jgi:polyhydroxyalkanoate synthase